MFKFLVLLFALIASVTATELEVQEEEEFLCFGLCTAAVGALVVAGGAKVGLAMVTGATAGTVGHLLKLF